MKRNHQKTCNMQKKSVEWRAEGGKGAETDLNMRAVIQANGKTFVGQWKPVFMGPF